MKTQDRWHRLMASYQTGEISDEDFAELEEALRASPEARRLFHRASRLDSRLRREAENSSADQKAAENGSEETVIPITSSATFRARPFLGGVAAAAAVVLLSALTWTIASQKKVIATLVSVENASWESSMPTAPGSQLTKGYLKLTSGVATIRFRSDAELTLEAPAKLIMKGPMRAKLVGGAAVMEVPEPAVGFVLETPEGYAVDYGTRFAVDVDGAKNQSRFEVIEGEIAIHHASSGEEVRLTGEGRGATLSEATLATFEVVEEDELVEETPDVIRIGTKGRATSVLPNNKREKFLPSDLLAVKKTNSGRWDHRSFFGFDVSPVNLDSVESARLRLNLVPSTRGYISRLPTINRFAIYGLTNPAKANWKIDSLWEEAPAPEDGVLLGTFEIPRSIQGGVFGIENPRLLEFLREHRGGSVTFILVRETTQIEGKGAGMTHTFASDSHPEAVGPQIEFLLKQ